MGAGCGHSSVRIREVLENIIESDNIKALLFWQIIGKESSDNSKSLLTCPRPDVWVRFDPNSIITSASGSIEKPAMRAPDVKNLELVGGPQGIDCVEDQLEICPPQVFKCTVSTVFVD